MSQQVEPLISGASRLATQMEDTTGAADYASVPAAPQFVLNLGQHVVTPDGDGIGVIVEVGDAHFKVHRRLRPDFWLATDDVRGLNGGEVVVSFARSQLDAHALDHPPVSDGLLSPSEQLEQRRKMEAGIAGNAQPAESVDAETVTAGASVLRAYADSLRRELAAVEAAIQVRSSE